MTAHEQAADAGIVECLWSGVLVGNAAQQPEFVAGLAAAAMRVPESPGVFDVLEVLGRDESLARLQDQAR